MSDTPTAARRAAEDVDDACDVDAEVRPARRALPGDAVIGAQHTAASLDDQLTAIDESTAVDADGRPSRWITSVGVGVVALALIGTSVWAVTRPADAPEQVQGVVASPAPTTSSASAASVPSTTATAAPTTRRQPVSRSQLRPALRPTALPSDATATARPKLTGVRWATAGLRARTAPRQTADLVEVIGEGTKLQVTSMVTNGYRQVVWSGQRVWVADDHLTATRPAEATESSSTRTTTKRSATERSTRGDDQPADSTISTAACPRGSRIEGGLTSRATAVYRAVCARFPNVSSYGGRRAGDPGDHGSGRAIDIMISGPSGWEIARWLRANAGRFGIDEVIYEQQIWTAQRAGEGWRSMSNRGSRTANHYDHVHVAVR